MSAHLRGKPLTGPGSPSWKLAKFLRPTLAQFFLLAFRVRIIGAEKVPPGGALLAGNHVSYLDPVLLWCASPRLVHFMAKKDLWRSGLLGWILDHLLAFPVHREGADRDAISTATSLLKSGDLVGMFPEGTRRRDGSEELGEAHNGVSFIAIRAGAPVVPVGISGTDKAWPPGRKLPRLVQVTIRFGDPVHPDEFEGGRKERVAAMTSEVMHRVSQARNTAVEV